MIRKLTTQDINTVMDIWRTSTILAHPFIPKQYWEESYDVVKYKYFSNANTYIYDVDGNIKGFISIMDDGYIGALFVDYRKQRRGIGTILIDYAKQSYDKLYLNVYCDNYKSVRFYKKCGFVVECEQIDENTNAMEYKMVWLNDLGDKHV